METPLDTVNRLVQAIIAGDLTTAVELYEPDFDVLEVVDEVLHAGDICSANHIDRLPRFE